MEKILKYALILISLIISVGGTIYKLYALNNLGIFLNLFISLFIFVIIVIFDEKVNHKPEPMIEPNFTHKLISLIYFLIVSIIFFILIKSATSESIISPWTEIPYYFFFLYSLATIFLIISISKNNHFSTLLISIHYFMSFSVAAIVYKLGYGFDPYIHEAAINHIIKNGFIEPKTFYYAGYYSLITTIHKLFSIPIFILNKFLVPAMAGILLPTALVHTLKNRFDSMSKIQLLALSLLCLPFSIFILSTPQNLAYLFLLLTVLFSLAYKNYFDLLLVYLLAISAFVIQPIAGIPAVIIVLYLTIHNFKNHKIKKLQAFCMAGNSFSSTIKKYFYAVLFLLSTFILPLLFLKLNNQSITDKGFFKNTFNFSSIEIIIPHKENILLNAVYLINLNFKYIFIFLIATGLFLAWKNKKHDRHLFIYLLMLLSSLISYTLVIIQPFDFLISYERANYANRLIVIALIFSVPFIILVLSKAIDLIMTQNKPTKIIITAFISIFISISLYTSYPRIDNYHNSHGTSTSADDIKAVQWINNDAKDNYIVLANQQVSAAALHEFEFKKYYKIGGEDIFYYSIPTGGVLYQHYLKMISEKASKLNANEAMDIVGANICYLIINKYWWSFPKLLEEAKSEANSYKNINNEVYIFKYIR